MSHGTKSVWYCHLHFSERFLSSQELHRKQNVTRCCFNTIEDHIGQRKQKFETQLFPLGGSPILCNQLCFLMVLPSFFFSSVGGRRRISNPRVAENRSQEEREGEANTRLAETHYSGRYNHGTKTCRAQGTQEEAAAEERDREACKHIMLSLLLLVLALPCHFPSQCFSPYREHLTSPSEKYRSCYLKLLKLWLEIGFHQSLGETRWADW